MLASLGEPELVLPNFDYYTVTHPSLPPLRSLHYEGTDRTLGCLYYGKMRGITINVLRRIDAGTVIFDCCI